MDKAERFNSYLGFISGGLRKSCCKSDDLGTGVVDVMTQANLTAEVRYKYIFYACIRSSAVCYEYSYAV